MKGWAEAEITQEDIDILEKNMPVMINFTEEENGLKGVFLFRKNTCTEEDFDNEKI